MKREVAVTFLRERCVFASPLSPDMAADLWTEHRRRVERSPVRESCAPPTIDLSPHDESAVAAFLEAHARAGGPVKSVVRVDARTLNVRQLGLTLDRCDHFDQTCRTRIEWIAQWLNPAPTSIEGRVRATTNLVNIELPHPEFVLGFDSALGFRVIEAPRYVTVRRRAQSTTLIAGHHRTFAYLMSGCAEADPTVLAAVCPDADHDSSSVDVMDGAADVCAARPPTMGDFLAARHAVLVKMRPRRFELQVRARMAVVSS